MVGPRRRLIQGGILAPMAPRRAEPPMITTPTTSATTPQYGDAVGQDDRLAPPAHPRRAGHGHRGHGAGGGQQPGHGRSDQGPTGSRRPG